MKLLVLCIFAMMATLAMSRSWHYVEPKFLNKASGKYRAAMKKGILTGFHRQLDGWLVENGKTVNNKQKKILRFVNIRYMQTHWPSFFKFALDRLKKLGRKPTVHDFFSIGAEIGRRVPIRFSYSVLISKGLLPGWADYMQDLLDTPPGKVKCRT
ncbi:egg-lysin isoform X2 [Haliotis rufescens]|uniref:egg-lysin isoform X2 n=1 Tax=Haliotis rufescens TaxID=6454 RepID=UPI001EB07D81|nr:egg-lysin isoform X2 [Haliotis rufescens]